jgi:hypothetical protein
MKRAVFLSLILMMLYACASKKQMTKTLDTTKGWIDYSMADESKTASNIDTSKLSEYDISITRIEYFPPAIPYSAGADSLVRGAIKSVEKIDFHKKEDQKGISGTASENKSSQDLQGENETTTNQTTKEKPVVNWRYVFYTLALLIIVFLYLKRKTIFQKIKSLAVSIWKMIK